MKEYSVFCDSNVKKVVKLEDCKTKEGTFPRKTKKTATAFFFSKIMKSTFLPLYLYIIGFYACNTFGASCRHGEYLSTAGECCPMCNLGLVVLEDCVGDYSTTCIPCTKGTFMNVPNGVNTCKTCKTCGRGLYILQNCSTIKDTVCEVLDGYYCVQHSDGECSLAIKHSECKPGEQMKTPGTRVSDIVCETCLPGFYSVEGVRCIKWTDCSLNNEIVDEEGTSITDVKCKPTRRRPGLIAAFFLIAALLTTAVSLLSLLLLKWWLIRHRRNRDNRKLRQSLQFPTEETNPSNPGSSSSSKVEKKQETDSPAAVT